MAGVTLLAFGLLLRLDGVAADTDSFTIIDERATPASAQSEHGWSLIQRSLHSGVATSSSDSQPSKSASSLSTMTDVEHLLEVVASGGKNAVHAEITHWDQEVETLAAQLEERRALLHKLRDESTKASADPDSYRSGKSFVPVPYYIHEKKTDSSILLPHPTAVVSQWYGDLLGDALEPMSHGETEDKKHAAAHHSHYVLLLLFGSLLLGCFLQIMMDRIRFPIPYTSAVFLAGNLVSAVHYINSLYNGYRWVTWYTSVDMWIAINPHLLFYIFLPALLFGDVMKLKVQLVAACSGQIFLLACPGLLIGTALTGAFAKYLLPYGWDWPICLCFGSILSATDPVAVVSLFNTLGVSPRLTMLISGESLVNDGTAIVVFALALKVAQGAVLSPLAMLYFFVYMTLPAICIGVAFGVGAVALIGFCSEVLSASDAMIQVVVTICCGYLVFFVAENEFSSSGVIATVAAGLAVAHSAWPLFVSRESVHIVWEAIEFVGNTVIFFLAGLIFMGTVLSRHFGLEDFTWLFILYVGIFIIRGVMILGLWIPLNSAGQPIRWQEGVAMGWSGLRGAVSLAMGMIVDIEPGIDNKTGSQVMFMVGGIAALTLIINSLTIGRLMKALGLVNDKSLMNHVTAKLSTRIGENVKLTFHKEIRNQKDARFYGANSELVKSMVPMLGEGFGEVDGELDSAPRVHNHLNFLNEEGERRLVQVYREVFLRVVSSRYWQGMEDGVIPRKLMVSRVLLHSTEEALDNTAQSLRDWDIIAKKLRIDVGHDAAKTYWQKFLSRLVDVWPFNKIPMFQQASIEHQTMMTVFIALSYIEAHTYVQEEIPKSLGRADAMGVRVEKTVIYESNQQVQKALNYIGSLPPEFVELTKSEMLARRLLRQHISEVAHKQEAGFLTHQEAGFICGPAEKALDNIARMPVEYWHEHLPSTEDSPKDLPEHLPGTVRNPMQAALVYDSARL